MHQNLDKTIKFHPCKTYTSANLCNKMNTGSKEDEYINFFTSLHTPPREIWENVKQKNANKE